jgi:hypothetical protein
MIPYQFKLNKDGNVSLYGGAKRQGGGTIYAVKFSVSKPMRLKISLYNDKDELMTTISDKIWTPRSTDKGESVEFFEEKVDMKPYPKGTYQVKLEKEDGMVASTFEYQ